MLKSVYFILIMFWSQAVWSCPNCAGGDMSGKNTTIVAVLATFILLIYIPFVLIFRTAIKHRNLNRNRPEA